MNDCENVTVREALPELLHGQLRYEERRLVEAHLTECVDCTEELAVLQAVLASAPAPRVNVTQIIAAIPAYRPGAAVEPQHPAPAQVQPGVIPLRPRSAWSARGSRLQLAAALAIAAVGVSTAALLTHERQQTAAVAASRTSAPAQGVALVSTADLSDAQLATLIKDMRSIQALPPTEPEPITPALGGGV